MSKKNKKKSAVNEPEITTADAYKINKSAVDRLVNASKETAPKVTEEEIAKYRGKKKFKFPNLLLVLLVKWWFSGAICFFFYFGLGTVVGDALDLLFIFAVALGLLTDLLTNHFLRFIEKEERKNDKYIMVTARKWWSLFLNLPYAFVILAVVMYLYSLIELLVGTIAQNLGHSEIAFGVEPVLFGLLYLGVDMVFVLIKNTLIKIFKDAKEKNRR